MDLEERKKGLGGSDSPVVLGVSPFKTSRELWLEKRGLLGDVEVTPAMERGTVLEPVVKDLLAARTGRKIVQVKEMLTHKDHPFMRAHLDGLISGDEGKGMGVLEVKCPGLQVFGKCKREGLPDYYLIQLQHYLAVSGKKWGSFAVFNAERWELIFFDMDRDDELINMIVVKDAEFWQMVVDGKEPIEQGPQIDLPPVGATDLIKLDTPEWAQAVTDLREARELKGEAEAIEVIAKARVQELMGDAGIAEGAGARIYWQTQDGRKSLDGKRLKKEQPEIHAQYLKQGNPFRVFKPYFLKGGIE